MLLARRGTMKKRSIHTGGGAYEDNAEGLFSSFDRIAAFLLARKSGELYVGGCTTPDTLPKDIRSKALDLARSLIEK